MSASNKLKAVKEDDNVALTFDVNDLTAADLAFIEEYSGTNFTEVFSDKPSMKTTIGIVYVLLRKDDATVTIGDVEGMKLNMLADALGNVDARPKS